VSVLPPTAAVNAPRARIVRGAVNGSTWELAFRPPSAALAPHVRALQGYIERGAGVVRRIQPPGLQVVVILELEPRVRVYAPGQQTRHDRYDGGFVAGIADTFTLTEHLDYQTGVQLNLHPLAARRVFGLPLRALREQAVHFRDLVRPEERGLCERLAELGSWDARFDLLEAFICQRLAAAKPANEAVTWALQRIAQTRGSLDIKQLTRELGYSHKHVIALFHDQVGVAPKLWARLVRFERLQKELARGASSSWAQLALTCGYFDQAHLSRDVRQFTGAPPGELLVPSPVVELESRAR
jgi:AraC-like DNA-binding protein